MPTFTFLARDSYGRAQRGTLEAANPGLVAQSLRQRGWMVMKVQLVVVEKTLSEQLAKLNPFEYLPPRSLDIEISCKQMALMLRGGLTLLTGLQAVSEQASRPTLRRIWENVAARLQEGSSFADAMVETKAFPNLLVQLVRVGEQTGNLEQSLVRAAETMEGRRRLRTTLLSALAYPMVVLMAALGVTGFMVIGVIPKLKTFIEALGRKLPPMTQFLIDISDFSRAYVLHFSLGALILTGIVIALYCHPSGRMAMDRGMLRIPILGSLFRLAGTANFARALGILVRSGITLLEGLRTSQDLLHNRYLSNRVELARQSIMQGGNLAEPLAQKHAFTPMLSRMVAVGETAGTIDDVLDEVAEFHEEQLQVAIRRLSVMVEPAIIIVVGGIVGFVYISFFLALFSAGGA